MSSSDLVAFLGDRLNEDEQVARAAIADDGGQDGGFEDATFLDDPTHPLYKRIATDAANLIRATAVPRRVLAEVEAKRQLIAEFERYDALAEYPDHTGGMALGLEVAVEYAALPYADHPDYREEWRP